MILFGRNITSPNDPLVKVPVANIFHALRSPKPETVAQVRQLRLVRSIDPKRYGILKRQLPYLVCGIFSPPCRRSENFAYIEYFILDIDHVSDKQLSTSELKQRFAGDSRTVLTFVSPSEDGLKVMFRLAERCYDKGLFSLFYKAFALQMARQYGIEQVIDAQTCDVTRACFVSVDPDAYYNPDAEPVDIEHYLPHDNPQAMLDLKHELESQVSEAPQSPNSPPSEPKADVDDETMRNIKAILNPKAMQKPSKPVFVPEQLNEIIDDLIAFITQTGVEVTEVVNISYGKKIRMKMRLKQAEVNLFYGKRGFSVVKSPRTGTDEEFNEIAAQLIDSFLMQNT